MAHFDVFLPLCANGSVRHAGAGTGGPHAAVSHRSAGTAAPERSSTIGFSYADGEALVITGPNGAGKSTLIRIHRRPAGC
jgi:ATPase subunit of ABC transporter with duplicated ATPase domains